MSKRIAILGGGMASLVTAYELSKLHDDNGEPRYNITVYQQGWRLGGKGASGRNHTKDDRIEEHGLHVLFGCYENTFRILREIYDTKPGTVNSPLADAIEEINGERQKKQKKRLRAIDVLTRQDAFHGHSEITTYERVGDAWSESPWIRSFPQGDGEPGDGVVTQMKVSTVIRLLLKWVRHFIDDWRAAGEGKLLELPPLELEALLSWIEDWLHRHNPDTDRTKPKEYVRVAELLQDKAEQHPLLAGWFNTWAAPASLDLMHRFANAMAGLAGRAAHLLHRHTLEDHLRQGQLVIDFSLTVLAGILRDRVIGEQQNWFSIDNWDFRKWLAHHGARPETLDSAFCNGLYMACFSSKHELGAGTILHAMFRVAHYRGHLFYRMQGGMGDIIFAPLYLVLRQQGVEFRFFMRVKAIHATGNRIDRVVIENQAPNSPDYEPLAAVRANDKSLLCWPHQPIVERLDSRDAQVLRDFDAENWWQDIPSAQTVTLKARSPEATTDARADEFDTLVLGISVGALSEICAPLLAGNPRFAAMVNSVVTTPTQAAQLWLKDSRTTLGGIYLRNPKGQPMVIPFEGEFDTCADMSHLLSWENVIGAETLIYVCSSLRETYAAPPPPHPGYVQDLRKQVLNNLCGWLAGPAAKLWPNGGTAGKLDDSCVVPPLLAQQHYIAVTNPSDRYVLAVPGSNARRMRADESGYDNMYLAGDWTKTAMSIGCLEAATMSGIQAAGCIDSQVRKAHFDWLP